MMMRIFLYFAHVLEILQFSGIFKNLYALIRFQGMRLCTSPLTRGVRNLQLGYRTRVTGMVLQVDYARQRMSAEVRMRYQLGVR
jgi:hypothetical protein